jgi:hypothetical protein
VAQLIPQLREEETPASLWMPILELGSSAHYWVEDFLNHWLFEGRQSAESTSHFVTCWKPMIEYAIRSQKWARGSGRNSFRLTEMWTTLMGLGFVSAWTGEADFAEPLVALLPVFGTWAARWLDVHCAAEPFAEFLSKPGAARLLLPGIRWLNSALLKYNEYDWHKFEAKDAAANALRLCWERHRRELYSDPQLKMAFMSLLTLLVQHQEPSALELHDIVIRDIKSQHP